MVKRNARVRWWRRRGRTGEVRVASWNVRSLVESEGSVDTACVRGNVVVEDRKIVRVVRDLQKYKIDIAGLQETHWFGEGTYNVSDRVILTSGRPSPSADSVSRRRGEGVALVLSPFATEAWRAGGCDVDRISSRILTARFKFVEYDGGVQWFRVIVAYAPTFASLRTEKRIFYDDLQRVLDDTQGGEEYAIVGDFNARIGSRTYYDEWSETRGPHGFGQLNSSGEELLSFLSMNAATVCNTWFKKKDTHLQTWQHPRTKRWHCIDYLIVSQQSRRRCTDTQVIPSAECGSDHNLLCMRFRLQVQRHHRRHSPRGAVRHQPYNVALLQQRDKCDHVDKDNSDAEQSERNKFRSHLQCELQQDWSDAAGADAKWTVFRDALKSTADSVIGHCKKRQPDWYAESNITLDPILLKRNQSYREWLDHGKQDDEYYQSFRRCRREARSAIRQAKTTWFIDKANAAEQSRFSGGNIWKSIRAIQQGCAGLSPVQVHAIKDEDGATCSSSDAQHQRWSRHFTKVLNIRSHFDPNVLEECCQREEFENLASVPNQDEVRCAIAQLGNGKAAGASLIVPELVKAGGDVAVTALVDLLQQVWEEEHVPQDWIDSVLVPIPKKGDLSICDNWRGIALLDVVGKAVARVLQTRLQQVAEAVLPDSQCGFRCRRSCTDMIFSVRQLAEKFIEHRTKAFCVFIDLKKAYDSVPRDGLWKVLHRLGVPRKLINIIRSFHTNMSTCLRLDGVLSDPIGVENGLRQGCCMAPVLFNLYMCAVVEVWCSRMAEFSDEVGVKVRFECDGQLLRKPRQNIPVARITEGQFADDSVLFALTRTGMEIAVTTLNDVAADFGLTVSFSKTKFMAMGCDITAADCTPLPVARSVVDPVSEFRYLGSLVDNSGRCSADIRSRVAAASRAFGALARPVFKNSLLSLQTKRVVFNACVLSLLLYGAECWVTLQEDVRTLTSFYMRCVRSILGISMRDVWRDHISTVDTLMIWGDERSLPAILRQRRLEWLGHVARMDDARIPKVLLFSLLPQRRPPGGPRKRWRDCVITDLKAVGALDNWYRLANESRSAWRTCYRQQDPSPSVPIVVVACDVCQRSFSRSSDKQRHKCLPERRKPVELQSGSIQCQKCLRWFRSKGGLAVHKCQSTISESSATVGCSQHLAASVSVPAILPCCTAHCPSCNRCFKSASGFRRHNCQRGKRSPVIDRTSFSFHCSCQRKFRRSQDLARHQRFCGTTSPPPTLPCIGNRVN